MQGFEELNTLEISGRTFTNVFFSPYYLEEGRKALWYTRREGIVAFVDDDGEIWRLETP